MLVILAMLASMLGMAVPVVAATNSVNQIFGVDPSVVCADGTLYYTITLINQNVGGANNATVDLVFRPPGTGGGATSLGTPVELANDLLLPVGDSVTFTWVGGGGDFQNAALEVHLADIGLDPGVTLVYGESSYNATYIAIPAYSNSDTKDIPAVVFYPCISGFKIDDCSQEGLEGWTINLKDDQGTVINSTTTDVDGFYSFCELMPGNYTVCEEVEDDWMAVGDTCINVTLGCEDATGVNFTNTPLLCIEGYKYDHATSQGLGNWTINLYERGGTTPIASTTTASNGSYSFCDLMPGNYTVCEEMEAGWVAVSPTCINVTLECEDSTGNNFENDQAGNEGCTPGYWKNNAAKWDAVSWDPTPYDPEDLVGGVFTIPSCVSSLAGDTLLEALSYKGGKGVLGAAHILLRAAVAALLNASHPDISYYMSAAGVISDVNTALASCDRATILTLAGDLDWHNNDGCVLDMHGNPIMIDMVG